MIHPCKHHTKATLARAVPNNRSFNMRWVFVYPATSHWAVTYVVVNHQDSHHSVRLFRSSWEKISLKNCNVCPFFYFDRVLRTNPVCLSGLFPDLHLPTHFIAVTTSRTVSELARLTHTLSQCEPNIGTPQVTSGGSGSVISPYYHKVSIRPCVSPLVLPRQ